MTGVVLSQGADQPLEAAQTQQVASAPHTVQELLAACHNLAVLQGRLVGDPLDKVLFLSSGWQLAQVRLIPWQDLGAAR